LNLRIQSTLLSRIVRVVCRTGYRAPPFHLPHRWGNEKILEVIMSNRGRVEI
jgi:hypothetical protein